jgi:hypothetical protein
LLACFDALEAAYADNIDWESRERLPVRAGLLLRGLFSAAWPVFGPSLPDPAKRFGAFRHSRRLGDSRVKLEPLSGCLARRKGLSQDPAAPTEFTCVQIEA